MIHVSECSDDAKRLYTDLLEGYNQFARPVKNASCAVKILFRMKLTQIADVEWHDYRLMWNPDDYGGQTLMHVPTNMIWLPDIILYNNAHGSPQVTTLTKAHVYNSGRVAWEPPVVYNFYCAINIEWFPYDEQFCELKFGSWTYYGSQLDMIQPITDLVELKIDVDPLTNETFKSWVVQQGADISEYQDSVEWDLMFISSHRHVQWYPCCDYPYIDITYKMNIRRKTLFYTINLVTPCVGITFLSCLVFYLPSDSNNKVTLCVSILVTLTVFFLLLVEIIPPTSITIPMIARYLTFTMIMILNVHYHPVSVTPVPVWIRRYILTWLPKVLLIETPRNIQKRMQGSLKSDYVYSSNTVRMAAGSRHMTYRSLYLPQPLRAACVNIAYIASNLTQQQIETDLRDDWKFVAIVIDRLFLIVFSSVIMTGTISIVLTAPTLRDRRLPATDNTSVQLPTDFKHINQTINFHDPCNWDLLMTLMKPTF